MRNGNFKFVQINMKHLLYKGIHYFVLILTTHRMWILIRTASLMQFYQLPTIYVLSNNKKNHLHSFDNCSFESPKDHSIGAHVIIMCIQLLFFDETAKFRSSWNSV